MKIAVDPSNVQVVGLVGGGVIGGGWAAHFLARGMDVVVSDPHPDAETRTRTMVERAWPALEKLGLAAGASPDRLQISPTLSALAEADFIQESAPENERLKHNLMKAIGEVARPDIVIASSTSGFLPTGLQASCKYPQRVLVGHPFNPVYLMPLVEIVGGRQTAPQAIEWAMSFYRHWGKEPLHCRTEIEGHLGNRLQAAVLHEALHLAKEGVASLDEMDAALCSSAGLRWALFGSTMTFRSNCGDADVREALATWAPVFQLPRSKLAAPEMTPELVETMAVSSDNLVNGHGVDEICRMRDEFLVGVIQLRAAIKEKYKFAQGRFF